MNFLNQYLHAFETVFNQLPSSILITDHRNKIIYINDSFAAYTGFGKTILRGKSVSVLIGNDGLKIFKSALDDKYFSKIEIPLLFKGEKRRDCTILCFELLEEKNVVGRVYIIDPDNIKDPSNDHVLQDNILRVMNSRSDEVWFITDIRLGKNLYTSDLVQNFINWPAHYFNEGGYPFFFAVMHPDEWIEYRDRHFEWVMMNNKLGRLYENVRFSKATRMRDPEGHFHQFVTEANVLEYTKNGKVRIEFGSFRRADRKKVMELESTANSSVIRLIDGRIYVEMEYIKSLERKKKTQGKKSEFENLTVREKEILELIAEALSSEEISARLDLSIHTINLHRKQIMQKLHARNLAELMRKYYEGR